MEQDTRDLRHAGRRCPRPCNTLGACQKSLCSHDAFPGPGMTPPPTHVCHNQGRVDHGAEGELHRQRDGRGHGSVIEASDHNGASEFPTGAAQCAGAEIWSGPVCNHTAQVRALDQRLPGIVMPLTRTSMLSVPSLKLVRTNWAFVWH